jgi:hypothetical protein
LRGYHANRIVKEKLKKIKSSPDEKDRKKQFKEAIEEAAAEVGHEPSTLRSQYLAPSLEADFVSDGKVNNRVRASSLLRTQRDYGRLAAGKYDHIDFKPPQGVADAAAKGLEYRRKASPSNRGGLTTEEAAAQGIGSGVQRAVNLKNRNTLSPETIKKMHGFFSRHEKNKGIDPEHKGTPWNDKGYVSWLLWGGDAGQAWAAKVVRQMESADTKTARGEYYNMTIGYPVNGWKGLHLICLKALVNPKGEIFKQHLYYLTGKHDIRRLSDDDIQLVADWVRMRYRDREEPMLASTKVAATCPSFLYPVEDFIEDVLWTKTGSRVRKVEYMILYGDHAWEVDWRNRLRNDVYEDDYDDYDDAVDEWFDSYANPLAEEVEKKLVERFGRGMFGVSVGEKGHAYITVTARGEKHFKGKRGSKVAASSLSSDAVKFLEVIAYRQNKVLNMNVAEEALEAVGLKVDEVTALLPLDRLSGLKKILPIRGIGSIRNIRGETHLGFKSERSLNSAYKKLLATSDIVSGEPSNPKKGQVYVINPRIEDGLLKIDGGWIGTMGWAIQGLRGGTILVPLGYKPYSDEQDPARTANTYDLKDALRSGGWEEKIQAYLDGMGTEATGTIPEAAKSTHRDLDGTGTCPACFANVKLTSKDRIMRHGWATMGERRKGEYGRSWHTGACFGVGYEPYELSKRGTEDFRKLQFLPWKERLLEKQEGLSNSTLPIPTRSGEVKPGEPQYKGLRAKALGQVRKQLSQADMDLKTLDSRISAWKPQPLPGSRKASVKATDGQTGAENRLRRLAAKLADVVESPHSFHKVKVEPPKGDKFVGYVDFQGLEIDLEVKANTYREKTNAEGETWRRYMHHHYGEIRGTEGSDGDKLDVYVGPNHDSSIVVVIHQHNPWEGGYDEDKVMVGFDSVEEAVGAYKKHYFRPGFYVEGEHTAMPIGKFWRWCNDERNQGKKVATADA